MKRIFLGLLTLSSFALKAQKNTFLDPAFWRGTPDVAAIRAEIDKGSNPAQSNNMAFDGVVYAINANAPVASIKFLLAQKGNEVNKLTHDSRTYIFWAASRGNADIVEYLISKGARVNIEDSHGMTPIGFAAAAGQANTAVYEALIKGGADVKWKNADGASLLLLAVPNDKDFALTNYFTSKGLSLKDADANGNTAFNYAARTGNIGLMKALVEKGVKYNDNAVLMATQSGRGGSAAGLEVFQYLESLKLKPTAVNKNGQNVLHNLARRPAGDPVLQYFLAKGVDVAKADNDGNTPFMNAAAYNRDTAALALLLTGIKNINSVNNKGVSALAMAVRSNSADAVQFLLRRGADTKTVDAEGNNLAYYLIQSYNPQAGEGRGPGGGGESRPQQGGGEGRPQGGSGEGRPGGEGRGTFNGPRSDDFGQKMKLLSEAGFNLTTPQKDGNTLYHLAVAKADPALLKRIEKLSVDVNAKNKEGLTPLHKAAMIAKDDTLLKYLLSIGAKKEAATEFRETAFDLAKENEYLSKNNVSVDFLK